MSKHSIAYVYMEVLVALAGKFTLCRVAQMSLCTVPRLWTGSFLPLYSVLSIVPTSLFSAVLTWLLRQLMPLLPSLGVRAIDNLHFSIQPSGSP